MYHFFIILIASSLLLAPASPFTDAANAIYLSKSIPHYARDMEFYYLNPRPQILEPLFRSFSEGKLLAQSENRLMLAAFLSELARQKRIDLSDFIHKQTHIDRNARHTLAWSAHLAGLPDEKTIMHHLLEEQDAHLLHQIRQMPTDLTAWDIHLEKSVPQMYWGAFMAGGNTHWLDAIIDLALEPVQNNSNHALALRQAAAASLYDYAPRHPLLATRLRAHLPAATPYGREILEMILARVPEKNR